MAGGQDDPNRRKFLLEVGFEPRSSETNTTNKGGGGLLGIVITLSRYYHGASLVLWATMVSTIVALVMPWYSIGKNRAVVTSILFKSLGDAECMASPMPLQLQLPEHLLHSLHISSSGLCSLYCLVRKSCKILSRADIHKQQRARIRCSAYAICLSEVLIALLYLTG